MKTTQKDFVDKETLKTYEEIDALKIIEQYLLFKGTDYVAKSMEVHISHLEEMAHIHYGLKVNATNKMYIGFFLEKYFLHNFMIQGKYVKIPKDIFDRVSLIHKHYKDKRNPNS